MSDIMTQEQIEELLRNAGQLQAEAAEAESASAGGSAAAGGPDLELLHYLSKEEQDALGEMGNICMGTAATTMYTLLGKQVSITTPQLSIETWETLAASYPLPLVVVEVCYMEGLQGNNLLVLKEYDVALITDLLIGGSGNIDPDNVQLDEIHLSAIREVMNQMVGSSATSMATMLNRTVNISTPVSKRIQFLEEHFSDVIPDDAPVLKIAFKMEIEGLLSSEIMQIFPAEFAKQIAHDMLNPFMEEASAPPAQEEPAPAITPAPVYSQESAADTFAAQFGAASAAAMGQDPARYTQTQAAAPQQENMPPQGYAAPPQGYAAPPQGYAAPPQGYAAPPQGYGNVPPQGYANVPPQGYGYPPQGYGYPAQGYGYPPQDPYAGNQSVRDAAQVKVQEVQYPSFDAVAPAALPYSDEGLRRLMNVPMQVTVELGQTTKMVKDVLEMNVSSVLMLDRLAGEPVDVLVNGIMVAKGEVVIIDENYGVRITDLQQGELGKLAEKK